MGHVLVGLVGQGQGARAVAHAVVVGAGARDDGGVGVSGEEAYLGGGAAGLAGAAQRSEQAGAEVALYGRAASAAAMASSTMRVAASVVVGGTRRMSIQTRHSSGTT